MLNFTGQTKKRVVNLGNKSNGGVNFLEQTRQQRQAREEQRKRERSASLIQAYVKSYIELSKIADAIDLHKYSIQVTDIETLDGYLSRFLFVCRWKRHQPTDRIINNVADMIQVLETRSSLTARLEKFQIEKVASSIILILRGQGSNPEITNRALHVLSIILNLETSNHCQFPGTILCLLWLTNKHQSPDILERITDIIFAVNVRDSANAFILALCGGQILPQASSLHKSILFSSIPPQAEIINSLSPQQKIQLLSSILTIEDLTSQPQIETSDFVVVGTVLSTISFAISIQVDDPDSDYEPELSIVVEQQIMNQLKFLYSPAFIDSAIKNFEQAQGALNKYVLYIISSLLFLIPTEKKKLCMIITITPGSYQWLFKQLCQNEVYDKIKTIVRSKDYLDSQDWSSIYNEVPVDTVSEFWKVLYTFEELYSYWLIVSNDTESFSDKKLSIEDIIGFMNFLKGLCLTLIFSLSQILENVEKVKQVSISLLNQLYSKNTRLQFLDAYFWATKNINDNIDSLTEIIAEGHERQNMDEDLSDEDQTQLHFLGPRPKMTNDSLARLEVLAKMPFIIPFKSRVKVFQRLIEIDKEKNVPISYFGPRNTLKADIRREYILEDAFNSFNNIGLNLKNTLSVTFFNEYGQEAGIDGGGITKEFLTGVVQEGFSPGGKFNLFKETVSNNQLYPNDEIFKQLRMNNDVNDQKTKLEYLRFLGAIVGKCLYENVLIDVSFAPFFISKWCNASHLMKSSINDLRSLDDELFQNLLKLNSMSESELAALDLNFVIEEQVAGKQFFFDLMPPNGKNIQVNSHNRLNYIHQISNFKLNQSLHLQTKYFLEGLFGIISTPWLTMFDPIELQMLVSGGEQDINIDDWKENVEYGGYFDDDLTVVYFWEVIKEMSPQERFMLVKFVTSVSRAPLLGFQSLSPKFGIRNSGREVDRLPTASTCVNLLKLPDYQDKEIIRSKLLYAISMGAGFDLS